MRRSDDELGRHALLFCATNVLDFIDLYAYSKTLKLTFTTDASADSVVVLAPICTKLFPYFLEVKR